MSNKIMSQKIILSIPTTLMYILPVLFATIAYGEATGNPVGHCPDTKNSYFLSDRDNRCVFYWCVNGQFVLPRVFRCAPGSGTVYGYEGHANPCTERVSDCYVHHKEYYEESYEDNDVDYTHHGGGYEPDNKHHHKPDGSYHSTGTYVDQFGIAELHSTGDAAGHSGIQSGQDNNQISTAVNYHGDYGTISITVNGVQGDGATHYDGEDNGGSKPTPRIVYKLDGYHVALGELQKNVYDATSCLHRCVQNTSCSGFDFNFRDQTCWFHEEDSVCQTPIAKDYCSHYRLVHCPSTTSTGGGSPPTKPMTPATPSPGGGVPPFAVFRDMCVPGGQLADLYDNEADCQTACILDINCQGVDFDRENGRCFMHMGNSVCGLLMPQNQCNHYRFVQCPSGTVMAFPETHALGGVLQEDITDPNDCIMRCQAQSAQFACVAIDYDDRTSSCWFHDRTTCANNLPKESCVHIRLQDCS